MMPGTVNPTPHKSSQVILEFSRRDWDREAALSMAALYSVKGVSSFAEAITFPLKSTMTT